MAEIFSADESDPEPLESVELELELEPELVSELLGELVLELVVNPLEDVAAAKVSVVDEKSDDPELDPELPLDPMPPKQPVATPKQLNCAVPQNCPNLHDHVSPR